MRGHWYPKGEPFVWPRDVDRELVGVIERACTSKEVEVLKLMAHGYGRRRIASILEVSESAVRQRRRTAKVKVANALLELAMREEVA